MLPIFTRLTLAALLGLGVQLFDTALLSRCCGQDRVEAFLNELKELGPEGENHESVMKRLPELRNANAEDGLRLMRAMDDQQPLQANWLRLSAQSIFQRQPPATSELRDIVSDNNSSGLSRVAAFEVLRELDPVQAQAIVPGFQKDPCLPLRRICIESKLKEIEASSIDDQSKKEQLQALLADARDIDQVDTVLRLLRGLDVDIERNQWLGFLLSWQVIGPFDNTGGKGFAAVYPIENQTQSPQFNKTWPGKEGSVGWKEITSNDKDGFVDVNKLLEKHNGAVVYLATNFRSDVAQDAQLRMGTYNAIKAWANGRQVLAREVYHNNEMVDQFVADIQLQKGDNWIVVKLCQNEQKENWAQNWRFLCRITDPSGKSIKQDSK